MVMTGPPARQTNSTHSKHITMMTFYRVLGNGLSKSPTFIGLRRILSDHQPHRRSLPHLHKRSRPIPLVVTCPLPQLNLLARLRQRQLLLPRPLLPLNLPKVSLDFLERRNLQRIPLQLRKSAGKRRRPRQSAPKPRLCGRNSAWKKSKKISACTQCAWEKLSSHSATYDHPLICPHYLDGYRLHYLCHSLLHLPGFLNSDLLYNLNTRLSYFLTSYHVSITAGKM